jgi:hypothetical protein
MHKSNSVINAFYCPKGQVSYYHHIQIIQILGFYFHEILCIVTLNFCDLEKEDVNHIRAFRHNEVLSVSYRLELNYWDVENFKDFGIPPHLQFGIFKASFYSPRKELSNAISNTSIRVDLTFENAKIAKLLVGLVSLSKLLICCEFV